MAWAEVEAHDMPDAEYLLQDVGIDTMLKVFKAIAEELHNHYALAYVPKKEPDGRWRAVTLQLARKDLEVRVRKGYFAVPRRKSASRPAAGG